MSRKKKQEEQETEIIDIGELVEAIDGRFNAIESVLSQAPINKPKKLYGFELVEERDDMGDTKGFHYLHIDKATQDVYFSKNYIKFCKKCGYPVPEIKEMNYFEW